MFLKLFLLGYTFLLTHFDFIIVILFNLFIILYVALIFRQSFFLGNHFLHRPCFLTNLYLVADQVYGLCMYCSSDHYSCFYNNIALYSPFIRHPINLQDSVFFYKSLYTCYKMLSIQTSCSFQFLALPVLIEFFLFPLLFHSFLFFYCSLRYILMFGQQSLFSFV